MTISAKIFSILTMVSEKMMCKISDIGLREIGNVPGDVIKLVWQKINQ